MNALGQARKAIFGETWALPAGVGLVIGGAVLLKTLAPGAWPDIGGPYLLVGSIVVLLALTRRRR